MPGLTPPPAIQTVKAARMMVAAIIGRREAALAVNGAAEFAAPDHQRVVQHAALFQVLDQRGGRLIGFLAALRQILRQLAVVVPVAMEKLDEAHAALGQPPRQQAIRREGARLFRIRPVQLERRAPVSLERSVNSGTELCMRNAISYCAMRVAISGSPNSSSFI